MITDEQIQEATEFIDRWNPIINAPEEKKLAKQMFEKGAKWMQEQSMRWVSVKERLPEHSKNLYCKDEKGNKRVAFYTLGNTYHIELDDDQELDFLDNNNFLIEGWYEWVETPGGIYDMHITPVNIIEYLFEPPTLE